MELNDNVGTLYHLNEIAGTFVEDSAGEDDATAVGAVADTGNQLLGAACRTFDGNDYITVPYTSSETEGSVGIFFQMPSMVNEQTFFMFTNGVNSDEMFGIRIWLGNVDILLRGGGVTHIHCNVGAVSVDSYHKVLFGVDPTGNTVHLDGVLQTPIYTTGDANSSFWFDDIACSVLNIGARDIGVSLSTYLIGNLDEFVIWTKRKTDANALEWWNGGIGKEIIAGVVRLIKALGRGLNRGIVRGMT